MEEVRNYLYNLQVEKELFYNESDMWGVYSFSFVDKEDQRESGVEINPIYKTFVISGKAPQLKKGQKRDVAFIDKMDDKYGKGYEFVEVISDGLRSPESQADFLRQMIGSDSHVDAILETYPPNESYIEDLLARKYDLKVIKGIKEKKEEQYLKSIQDYHEYQEAIVKLSPLGAGIKTIERLVLHFGGSESLIQVLDNNIYRVTEVDGFGFKRVDELALKLGYDMSSSKRLIAGADYVLLELSEKGDIKIPIEDFDAEMCRILEIPEVNDALFEEIMSDGRFTYSDGFICLERLRLEEVELSQKIVKLITEVEEIESLEDFYEEAIKENEEANGFEFNKNQIKAIKMALKEGLSVLTGGAGSGKSSCVKTVVDIYKKAGYEPVAMALSGKAAQVMAELGVKNSGTIHRKLGYHPVLGFSHHEFNPLKNKIVFLDEASMINNSIFKRVIDAIKLGNRILIIGDDGQLAPIGHGAVLDTLLKTNVPTTRLDEIHRQAAKSGIITVANEVRHGEQINSYGSKETQVVGELKDMRIFNYIDKTKIYTDIMTTVKQYLKNPNMNPEDLQVITAMKRGALGVPVLNKGMQDAINPHPRNGKLKFHLVKGQELRVGDRVIQNGNLYEAVGFNTLEDYKEFNSFETNVYNGTIGYVVAYEPSGLLVRFDEYTGTKYVLYYAEGQDGKKPIGMLELAYAITTHRSQGSGFKTVIFTFDYSAYMLLSKEFVYTGITRAIDNCLMFVENTALHHAIKHSHSNNRLTFLREFLEAELENSGVVA